MDIKKTITKNAQALIAIGTLIGMGIGVINFFILASVAPLEKRVEAIEDRRERSEELISEFIEVRTDVRTIKEDIKDIKSLLGLR